MSAKEHIDLNKLPQHVAVIMDGNGRWARTRGEERVFGHMNGVNSVRETLTAAAELGVKYLTLYAFSSENWDRPASEVAALMDLLVQTIVREVSELHEKNVRLEAIGDLDQLPPAAYNALKEAIAKTCGNSHITLVLALSYSSRREIANAAWQMAQEYKEGRLSRKDFSPEEFAHRLQTRNWPDPELLIRTSGEKRISNFLLWQIAYAELYFTPKFWPEFTREDFYEAILDFQQRERRFGKISEQIMY